MGWAGRQATTKGDGHSSTQTPSPCSEASSELRAPRPTPALNSGSMRGPFQGTSNTMPAEFETCEEIIHCWGDFCPKWANTKELLEGKKFRNWGGTVAAMRCSEIINCKLQFNLLVTWNFLCLALAQDGNPKLCTRLQSKDPPKVLCTARICRGSPSRDFCGFVARKTMDNHELARIWAISQSRIISNDHER